MPPYQSLYRKHRPQTFAALVGQEHVTTALRNAAREGRVGHAYLFSGPRGTGKTTTARILAKALNCLDPRPEGEPCDKCEHCVAIREGTFVDLFELDAASNRGINEMRDLLPRLALGTAVGSTKVYILDEVHMLTAEASNALLKSLEEPPGHVVFVMATTNPEKVLPTIRSRTQHFEFTLLTSDQLEAHLTDVLEKEGVEADADALPVLARAAAGSARDALSLLDQALAHGTGRLEAGSVTDLLGRAPFDMRGALLDAVAAEDAATALTTLSDLLEAGHEPRRVAEDLLAASRDAFLMSAGGGRVGVDLPDAERERLAELGRVLGNPMLVRVLETLGQAVVDMRGTDAADPRLVLEVALVRLCRRDAGPPIQSLAERVERLERAVAEPKAGAPIPAAPSTPRRAPGRTIGAVRRETESDAATGASDDAPVGGGVQRESRGRASETASEGKELDLDDVIVAWADVLPELPVATRSAVREAQPVSVADDIVTFAVPPHVLHAAAPRFRSEKETIRDALAPHLGRRVRFNIVGGDVFDPPAPTEQVVDLVDEERVDLNELVDVPPGTGPGDGVSLLADGLGATVVEERPRD